MSDFWIAVIPAAITGGITLVGTLIANSKSQAITDTKIDELTREVREHNNFARRMPVVEEQIKVINHRISDLEEAQKNDRKN
nr:MAG TPA: Low affinity iron permease [Caudoviricetes sp.]